YRLLVSLLVFIFVFFFFSSRRRHTRSYGDWSSDVCSSDLVVHVRGRLLEEAFHRYDEQSTADVNDSYGAALARGRAMGFQEAARSEERRVGKEGRRGGGRGP